MERGRRKTKRWLPYLGARTWRLRRRCLDKRYFLFLFSNGEVAETFSRNWKRVEERGTDEIHPKKSFLPSRLSAAPNECSKVAGELLTGEKKKGVIFRWEEGNRRCKFKGEKGNWRVRPCVDFAYLLFFSLSVSYASLEGREDRCRGVISRATTKTRTSNWNFRENPPIP